MKFETELSTCEEFILKVIWDLAETKAPVKGYDLMDVLEEKYGSSWKMQTVFTFITRMKEKGVLKVEKIGRYSYYTPLISREEYYKEKMDCIINLFYDGDAKKFLHAIPHMYPKELEAVKKEVEKNAHI